MAKPRSPGPGDAAAAVRASDRDRYIASLFAPPSARAALFALHAFDLVLTDIVLAASDAQLGLIRIAWWRDAVAGPPIAGAPLLAAIHAAKLDTGRLVSLAEAHMDWLDGGERPAMLLFETAARLLGTGADENLAAIARYWAAGQDARIGQRTEPGEVPPRCAPRVRPLTALAATARRDLCGKREPRGSAGRQLAIFRHILTGRF